MQINFKCKNSPFIPYNSTLLFIFLPLGSRQSAHGVTAPPGRRPAMTVFSFLVARERAGSAAARPRPRRGHASGGRRPANVRLAEDGGGLFEPALQVGLLRCVAVLVAPDDHLLDPRQGQRQLELLWFLIHVP